MTKNPKCEPSDWLVAMIHDKDVAKRFDEFCRKKMVSRSSMIRLGIDLVMKMKELPGLEKDEK